MRKRILFCATVDYHFKAFHIPYLKWFQEKGWEVHIAANGDMDLPFVNRKYNIPITRSPLNYKNIKAYDALNTIINCNQYKIIHCHTPVGGALARLAAREARKKGTNVIYTAHGFHFCKGAPLISWLIYYPIEKVLAAKTDCLITINNEDYQRAISSNFKANRITHIHGVGVDTNSFKPIARDKKRSLKENFGFRDTDFIIFYAAEFNKNKNQQLLIEALAEIKHDVPNARLLLAGEGRMMEECKKLSVNLDVERRVEFLGYRNDIISLLNIADLAVGSSKREGLPVNIMEAMACGLPIVATANRGHNELVINHKNGWIIGKEDIKEFAEKIKLLAYNEELRYEMGASGRKIILDRFSAKKVLEEAINIYKPFMGEVELEEKKWATP